MFPRNQVKWVNKVHEHPECELPVKVLPGHIEHYTYKKLASLGRKTLPVYNYLGTSCIQTGKTNFFKDGFFHSLGAFFKMFVMRAGFLDGWMGTYMCFNHFFYTMLKYLKLYELQKMERR